MNIDNVLIHRTSDNICKYIIKNEEHTLGCLIRSELLKNKYIIFAGYVVKDNNLEISIQTSYSDINNQNIEFYEALKSIKKYYEKNDIFVRNLEKISKSI